MMTTYWMSFLGNEVFKSNNFLLSSLEMEQEILESGRKYFYLICQVHFSKFVSPLKAKKKKKKAIARLALRGIYSIYSVSHDQPVSSLLYHSDQMCPLCLR